MDEFMRNANEIIHYIYFGMAGVCGLVLLRGLFLEKRVARSFTTSSTRTR